MGILFTQIPIKRIVLGKRNIIFPPGQGVRLPLRVGVQVAITIKLIWVCLSVPFLSDLRETRSYRLLGGQSP